MRINSARAAWHDAYYTPGDSIGARAIERARLGADVSGSGAIGDATRRAVHQALAGRVQQAIGTLRPHIRAFGHWLYNPLAGDDEREAAEALVYARAYVMAPRMTASKAERARYVAAGVVHRYRRMTQGGQGAGLDPLPTPEAFRRYVLHVYGVRLPSTAWGRDWQPWESLCFCVCDDLDRAALAPVAAVLATMREASDPRGEVAGA